MTSSWKRQIAFFLVCVASSIVVYTIANVLGIRATIMYKGNSIVFLTLGTMGIIFRRRHIEFFFFFFFLYSFPENRFDIFLQIVSNGESLHKMSNLV